MTRAPGFIAGDWLMICDRSGLTYRRSEMVKEEKTGLWVHKSEVDPPHPQQYRAPVKPDRQAVSPVRAPVFARASDGGGELPDGSISDLPEMAGGRIDDTPDVFLAVGEVNPESFSP